MHKCSRALFFCIFLQKKLHIWKIFCNFVAVLGIVPTATINCLRVMSDKCIFKASAKGKTYRVEEELTKDGQVYFVVRSDRRYVRWPFGFEDLSRAIERAVGLAKFDLMTREIGEGQK